MAVDFYNMDTNEKVFMAITSGACDAHHVPVSCYEAPTVCIAIEGNGARPSHRGGGDSTDGRMFTLNTVDRLVVCYGISPYCSNAMLSDNPHSGIYEATTSRTLDLNGGNPVCNLGGVVIVIRKDCETTPDEITRRGGAG